MTEVKAPPKQPVVSKPPMQEALPFRTVKSVGITRFSIFVYGFSGAGKTPLIGTATDDPKNFLPAVVMVCDNGEASIEHLSSNNFLIVPVDGMKTITDVYHYVKAHKEIKMVAIDNVTELHRRTMNWHVKNSRAEREQKSLSEFEYSRSEYGKTRTQVLSILNEFNALNATGHQMHLVVTALAASITDETSLQTSIVPNLPGKLEAEAPSFFDVVGFLREVAPTGVALRNARKDGAELETYRELIVSQTTTLPYARNRRGRLGNVVVNPTLPTLFNTFKQKG